MTGHGSTGHRSYRRMLVAAAAAVTVERSWPALWPVFAVVAGFLAIALLDVLPMLPGWLHVAVLVAFGAATVLLVARAVRSLTPVDRAVARRRLEADSVLAHRPLAALQDTLTAGRGDPVAEAMWHRHRIAAANTLDRLTVRLPAPDMARRDPRAVRVLVLLLLSIAVAAGLGDPSARLARAVCPDVGGAAARLVAVDLWITPPAYTRSPPVNLRDSVGGPGEPADARAGATTIEVPAGSGLLAQVHGVTATPSLRIGGSAVDFTALGSSGNGDPIGWRAEATATAGDRLTVAVGRRVLASWPIRIVPDQAPEIAFTDPPRATSAAMLALDYEGRDDHGITGVVAVIVHADGRVDPEGAAELRFDLPVLAVRGDDAGAKPAVDGSGLHDLAPHAWAGEPVRIRLEARDAAGQTGHSTVAELTLPERVFTHPVAQAVIAERKLLVDASPSVREAVGQGIAGIAVRPEHFAHDSVVSLALAVARSRLLHDRSEQVVSSVRSILWQTALRLEQGAIPVAEQALREARQRLWEALRNGADAEEIEQLIDEVERALNDYLEAIAAELARKGDLGEPVPSPGDLVTDQDLRDLLDAARDLARSGARDSAQQLLSELNRILDQLRSGLRTPSQTQEMVEAHRLMKDIRDLAARQQALLDRTFEALRQLRENGGRQGSPGERRQQQLQRGADGKAEQEALRRELGEAMRQFDELMGGIPAPLGEAERAMKGAETALGDGRFGDAVPSQGAAVDSLRAASEQAAAMIRQRFGQGPGMMPGAMADGEEDGNDPFGRSGQDGLRGLDSGRVDIPDRMELREVEQILRELRRRAGEFVRPQRELEYIDRLLRRF